LFTDPAHNPTKHRSLRITCLSARIRTIALAAAANAYNAFSNMAGSLRH
jgi:hypothetical protein